MTNHGTEADHHGVPPDWKWPPIPPEKELDKAYIAFQYRDRCVGLLLDWMKCTKKNYLVTMLCEHENLKYERCLYYDFLERKEAFDRQMMAGKPPGPKE